MWYLCVIINYPSRISVLVFFGKVHIRVSDTYCIRYPYQYPCNIENFLLLIETGTWLGIRIVLLVWLRSTNAGCYCHLTLANVDGRGYASNDRQWHELNGRKTRVYLPIRWCSFGYCLMGTNYIDARISLYSAGLSVAISIFLSHQISIS